MSFPRKWACTREGESSALIILDSRLRGSDEDDLSWYLDVFPFLQVSPRWVTGFWFQGLHG